MGDFSEYEISEPDASSAENLEYDPMGNDLCRKQTIIELGGGYHDNSRMPDLMSNVAEVKDTNQSSSMKQTSLLVDDELEDCKQETDNLCDTTTTLAAGINDTWRLFCEFEDQAFVQAQNSKQQHQTFSDFVELWLARLDGVRQLGLHYPEKVLALKLVKQAGLDDESQRCVLAVLHTYMLLPDHRDLLQETTTLLKTLAGEKASGEDIEEEDLVKEEQDRDKQESDADIRDDAEAREDLSSTDEVKRKKKVVERDELGNCKKCLKSFTSLPTLKKHQRTCTKRLQCDDCDEVCPDPEALRKHKKSHVYKCEFCFKECINKNQLNTHRTRVHAEKVYKCQLCDSSFPTANWLKAHAKVHNKVVLTYKCDQCGKDFVGKDNFKQHRRTHEKYKCDPCYKFFRTQERLDEHIANHKFFRCEECNISFTQNHKYQKHMQTARHGLERTFQCDKCEKSFVKNCGLQEHMRKHDEEERKFKCSVCGKKFFTKDRLNVHSRIHTGEKPYECEICFKRFTQSGDRNKHRRTHGDQQQQHQLQQTYTLVYPMQ